MADNSTLNPGSGGDTVRDKDRASVKTPIVGVDLNIGGASEVLQTASALADATANPTIPLYGVCLIGYNGTTWDRLRSSTANGLVVDVSRVQGSVAVTGTFWQATQPVSGTVAATQSGTWNVTNISGTVSLPTGAATAAKQPALGTAGTASADVITVQGIASMTALKVDGSAVTQPVSGTFWQATQPVSGTVTANAGTGTFTVSQANLATADYDTGAGTSTQAMVGIALPASGGPVAGGTSTNPLRTDPTGTTTQPVSGTVTANAGTGTFTISGAVTQSGTWNVGTVTTVTTVSAVTSITNAVTVVGAAASGASKSGNPVQIGGVFNTTQPTVTTGQMVEGQYTARGAAIVATGVDTFHATVDNATLAVTQSGTWTLAANQSVNVAQVNGVAPSMGNGVSGTGVQRVTIASDSTGQVTLAAGSNTIGALTANQSVNVAQVAGASTATGHGTASGALRVELPTDGTGQVNALQSGTWTVQPGNTANSTPWLVTDTPATSGGLSFTHITAGASNNKTQVKGSAGQLYAIHAINLTATTKYIKVFDKTSANVTAGTTAADYQFPIPANSTTGAGFVLNVDKGIVHANGITVMLTGAVSLTDNTALSANDVVCTFFYK